MVTALLFLQKTSRLPGRCGYLIPRPFRCRLRKWSLRFLSNLAQSIRHCPEDYFRNRLCETGPQLKSSSVAPLSFRGRITARTNAHWEALPRKSRRQEQQLSRLGGGRSGQSLRRRAAHRPSLHQAGEVESLPVHSVHKLCRDTARFTIKSIRH